MIWPPCKMCHEEEERQDGVYEEKDTMRCLVEPPCREGQQIPLAEEGS